MHERRVSSRHLLSISVAAAALLSSTASRADDRADSAPPPASPKVSIFAATGWLASPGENGAAFEAGMRFGLGRRLALSFDLGYGVLAAASGSTIQDRWWLMPALAYVASAGKVRLDVGAGFGLGASSGYASWPAYAAEPFTPKWAYQLMPTARAHAVAAIDLGPKLGVFARLEAAKLLVSGADGTMTDTAWATLSVGAAATIL
jgi:hypothetical protein